jgi:predicted ester cyclase
MTAVQERNKAIVQRWIDEVFNAGQLGSVDELKVSSYLDWTPLPAPYQQVDLPVSGIKDALPEWRTGLPDFEFASDRLMSESEFVVCLGHWQATHAGAYKGHAPSGKRVGGTRIDIFRVAGDKMVEHWGCGNELAFMRMIGALEAREQGDLPATDEDVARAFVERVFGERDLASVAELLDPHAIGHAELGLSALALVNALPDLELTIEDVSSAADGIVVRSLVTGTHERDYYGIPPTGESIRIELVNRFRVVDGRIVEAWRESAADEVSPAAEPPGQARRAGDVRGVARAFIERVLNERDFGALEQFVDPRATEHLTGALTAYLTLAAFPDFQLNTEHLICEDDVASVLATFTGTHDAPVLGIPPTGTGVTGRVAFSFRVAEGRIAETWIEIEPWTLLQQLGAHALA